MDWLPDLNSRDCSREAASDTGSHYSCMKSRRDCHRPADHLRDTEDPVPEGEHGGVLEGSTGEDCGGSREASGNTMIDSAHHEKSCLLVTIITVVYNAEKTIRRIVIDGGSSDHTAEIARSYEDQFTEGRSLTVLSEPDHGMYDALNKGARLAHGEIVGQINADDWYESDAVSRMVELYQRTGFDMAYADLRMINPDGTSWIKKAKIDRFVNTRHWNHPTQFTRRELLLEHPYPCECMSDDLDLLLWLRSSGKHIEVLNEVIANFTVEGMSHSKSREEIRDRIRTKTKIYHRYGYSFLHMIDVSLVEIGKFVLETGARKKLQ